MPNPSAWSRSLELLLKDEEGFKFYRNYLKSQNCDESIDFWKAVEEYRSNIPKDELEKQSNHIFKMFISNNGRRTVNIEPMTRSKIALDLKAKPTRYIFDLAQNEIIEFMRKDSYQKFLDSEEYKNLLV